MAIENDVRKHRVALGWSQDDLAVRSGLSRTGIGAIEAGRLVPSTAAALALAAVLGCRVEALFRLQGAVGQASAWAWEPRTQSGRFWHAEVGGRTLLYPVEASPLGVIPARRDVSSRCRRCSRKVRPSQDPGLGRLRPRRPAACR